MTLEPLTEKDAARFETLTNVVLENKESFLTACMALAQIHRDRLYRQDFLSFEAYCRDRLGFTRQHGYRLIDFANQVEECNQLVTSAPANEHQARSRKAKEKSRVVAESQSVTPEQPHRTAESGESPHAESLSQPQETPRVVSAAQAEDSATPVEPSPAFDYASETVDLIEAALIKAPEDQLRRIATYCAVVPRKVKDSIAQRVTCNA